MFLARELPHTVLAEARELRLLRRRLKITQNELAGMLDVSVSTLIRLELGLFKWESKVRTDPYKTYRPELRGKVKALLERWRQKPPKARLKWKSGAASPKYKRCKQCAERDPNAALDVLLKDAGT